MGATKKDFGELIAIYNSYKDYIDDEYMMYEKLYDDRCDNRPSNNRVKG